MPASENIKMLESLILGKGPKTINYLNGTIGTSLYCAPDATIQRAFLPAGTIFEEHAHQVTEVIVVLSGIFHTKGPSLTTVVEPAAVVIYAPGIIHSHRAETDCYVIGMLIPRNGGYPAAT